MKPIIVEMSDMSDSVEVYKSKPNPFFIYVIYTLVAILVIAIGWMYFSKIDIVVKSNGIFKSNENVANVSIGISGILLDCNIEEGKYVEKGDILFTINVESLDGTIKSYEDLCNDVKERIEILKAYEKYLDGEANALEECINNQYYKEFSSRKNVLNLSNENADTELNKQIEQYNNEINTLLGQISEYENKIAKFQQAEECVKNRKNTFLVSETYYESVVSSYISNYNITVLQYDNQILGYEKIDDKTTVTKLLGEKESALINLELQQIATIEQQIETINSALISAKNNMSSIKNQIKILNEKSNKNTTEISILTEKQNVATELISCYTKQSEYENTLKQYNLDSGNANVLAETSGYIYMLEDLGEGCYVSQGSTVCQILPENTEGYYAEIYVENSDIAKIEEGMDVKFEIAAYPSSEYGYFTGVIESISKNIKVDQTSGSAYYLVKVHCEQAVVTNKEGKAGSIINGMACQAKIVIDEKNVLRHLLEKLELVD